MRWLLFLAVIPALAAPRWTVQYFYDDPRAELTIADLAFPTAQRGIAAGWTMERGHKPKPVSLVTGDEGAHWTVSPLPDLPRSLFFLNESTGWMVTEEGLWFTEESGRSWRKIWEQTKPDKKLQPVPPGGLILRVWFLDAQHGFAAGYRKTVLETLDGGHTWKPVADAAKPNGTLVYSAYTQIAFDGPRGLIIGTSLPPQRGAGPMPSWIEPDRATKQRKVPSQTLLLETADGGAHWTASNTPLFGSVDAVRLVGTEGLDLFSYGPSFEWPSEVYKLDLNSSGAVSVFREANRKVTDIALFAGPKAYLAAVEPTGTLNTVPIPGAVKILTSTNLTDWEEMTVDYRAQATTLCLAGPDASHLWAATDTGMILHLVK
jgi:Photosynthesis system II assembly factor YCF48